MADINAKFIRTVDKLLARYGKDCAIVKIVPGGYNPATGTVEGASEVTYAARAVETGYTLENLPGTLIAAGDKVGIVKITDSTFTGDVALTMKLRLQGDKLRNLLEAQPVAPGPSCLYWKFVARG